MKVYNSFEKLDMCDELYMHLNNIRSIKNFDVEEYVNKKCDILNYYMNKYCLSGCVVAVSGGIDSSVVLSLVHKASQKENSPIKKIVPISMPIYDSIGVTNQKDASNKAKILCNELKLDLIETDLSKVNQEYRNLVESKLKIGPDAWAIGQLGPYSRTPMICYVNTLLNYSGFKSISIGTTNRSEFGYIGYVGKFSDEAVDVQLISDIYKSQVIEVAKYLNVPDFIISATPRGDMFDNRSDEQVFGASYDFLELYCEYLNWDKDFQKKFKDSLSKDAKNEFEIFAKNLETLHEYNLHKYMSKSPAIHLDLFDASVKGGIDNYYDITQKLLYSKN